MRYGMRCTGDRAVFAAGRPDFCTGVELFQRTYRALPGDARATNNESFHKLKFSAEHAAPIFLQVSAAFTSGLLGELNHVRLNFFSIGARNIQQELMRSDVCLDRLQRSLAEPRCLVAGQFECQCPLCENRVLVRPCTGGAVKLFARKMVSSPTLKAALSRPATTLS